MKLVVIIITRRCVGGEYISMRIEELENELTIIVYLRVSVLVLLVNVVNSDLISSTFIKQNKRNRRVGEGGCALLPPQKDTHKRVRS